jgi:preprotein translocase subunit SecE
MAMNRETKRMLQRQGQLGPDGEAAVPRSRDDQRRSMQASRNAPRERTGPATYLKEVRAELRKVAWPTRDEVVRYSIIVLFTLIVLTALIFGLDWVFAKAVLRLFD